MLISAAIIVIIVLLVKNKKIFSDTISGGFKENDFPHRERTQKSESTQNAELEYFHLTGVDGTSGEGDTSENIVCLESCFSIFPETASS